MPSKTSTESATASAADLATRFADLAATWKRERGPTSKSIIMAAHPAYREIVAMGEKAVPLILAELEREPDHWDMALDEITGADPVPEEDWGKIGKIAAAWIAWGRAQGYRW